VAQESFSKRGSRAKISNIMSALSLAQVALGWLRYRPVAVIPSLIERTVERITPLEEVMTVAEPD